MTKVSRPRWVPVARGLAALLLLGGTALGATACGGDDQSAGGSSTSQASTPATKPVGVDAFAAAIAQPGTKVLDVRTPAEYAAGHLAGAVDVDVQGSGFAAAVAALDPSATYAVYCHSGNRSAVAVAYLVAHGFTHVVELEGGISAWQAAGRPVTTS